MLALFRAIGLLTSGPLEGSAFSIIACLDFDVTGRIVTVWISGMSHQLFKLMGHF